MEPIIYKNLHFPASIVQHTVWLYARFNLSLRDVEELMAERGIDISYETVRRWVARFGPQIAKRLRRAQLTAHPQRHLDEMYVSIGGRWMYLWRAIDQEGQVLEVLVQSKRDKKAALKLMRKLLKKTGLAPRTIVTDKWRAYAAAFPDLGLTAWAPSGKVEEQPHRRIALPNPTTRTIDAGILVARICPTVPRHPCRRLQHLRYPPTSRLRR